MTVPGMNQPLVSLIGLFFGGRLGLLNMIGIAQSNHHVVAAISWDILPLILAVSL